MDIVKKLVPVFLACLAVLTMISCRPEPVMPDDARILILDPPAEANLPSGDVTIRTFVEYFKLVDKIGEINQLGQGHIVYYMDVNPPVVKGELALTDKDTFFTTTDTSHLWKNVPPGSHVFWVQLVNNDNTPLEPPAAVRVPVTIAR